MAGETPGLELGLTLAAVNEVRMIGDNGGVNYWLVSPALEDASLTKFTDKAVLTERSRELYDGIKVEVALKAGE